MNQDKSRRRILFLFAHLHKGGMQKACSNISLALPDQFEQFVGYFGTENPGFIYNAKLHDFQLPGAEVNGIFRKVSNLLRRIIALRVFVASKKIDVVVSFGESANIYSLMSGHNAKKIITSRVALFESLSGNGIYARAYRFLVNRLYPKADEIVAVSEALAKDMLRISRGSMVVKVIPNLYHVSKIQKLAEELLPLHLTHLNNTRFLLNVGSLCYQKAQDDLLKIFEKIYSTHTDVVLVIVGRGEWYDKLRNMAKRLGILDRVIIVDFDLNPYRYMSKASAFVLTSRYEGFPNVLVEAMICSAPVVAFDCPTGPAEILSENSLHGILIKDRSIDDAANSITRLLDDLQFNQLARVTSKERGELFSADAIATKWVAVLA